MNHVKGYVVDYYKKIPVTWETETEKFVENVRKVHVFTDKIIIDERIYDTKIPKKEIINIMISETMKNKRKKKTS